MSDTAAAKLLNEQNLIFSNDSLSPQERIYQLYMLLLRYDKSGNTNIPETPNPSEDVTNMVGGAIGPLDDPVTKHSANPTEEQQGLHRSLAKPVEAQDNPTEEEEVKTEDTHAGGTASATVPGIFGSVVHDDSEVLHEGQNKEEEINVPVVAVETGGADRSAANVSGTGGIGADKNGGPGEAYAQSTGLIAAGGEFNAAKVDNAPELDCKSCVPCLTTYSVFRLAMLSTNSFSSKISARKGARIANLESRQHPAIVDDLNLQNRQRKANGKRSRKSYI